jgi:3-hydroxybutyryl-CoA dehydratase
MREGDALPTVERHVTQARIDRYAEASGDFNPIHIDTDFAAASQFGGTIAHGMMIAAAISEVMSAAFRMDWVERGRLKLRFKAPVFPGDTVTAFGSIKRIRERDGVSEVVCSVGVRRQDGQEAITGEAIVLVAQPG